MFYQMKKSRWVSRHVCIQTLVCKESTQKLGSNQILDARPSLKVRSSEDCEIQILGISRRWQ